MKHSVLEEQLSKIERLAELKAELTEQENYEKYHHLFEMTIAYLKKQHVLLYGGYAINELMPAKDKIYKKYTLPDIDVFAAQSTKVAKGLVKMFKDNGIELTNYSEALHPGTYKVFAQGIQIADITGISHKAFDKLDKHSVRGPSGLRVVDPQFLRLSLHMLLSQANNADRWPKVFARLNTFYRNFPPELCKQKSDDVLDPKSQMPEDLVSSIYKYLKGTGFVVFGSREIQEMANDKIAIDSKVPWIQIIADKDLLDVAKAIMEVVPGHTLRVSKVHAGDDFIGPHVFLTLKGVKVVAIYYVEACVTFNNFKGMRVATIHTVLRMYLSMLMSPYKHFEQIGDHLECMVNALSILQQKSVNSKKQLLQQMVIDCFGTQQGLITLKRERLIRLMQKSK